MHARAPLLERLIARADGATHSGDWRVHAFRLIVPGEAAIPAVASAAQAPDAHRSAGSWVCMATPVHLLAGMSSVGMAADGVLEIDAAEADALTGDFNRVFGGKGGLRLERGRDALLLARFDAPLRVTMSDPAEALGRDIWAYLPRGEDAARVRGLTSEIEMWLFDHAVNRKRREDARAEVSSLWLWGAVRVMPRCRRCADGRRARIHCSPRLRRCRATRMLRARESLFCPTGRGRPRGSAPRSSG